MTALIHERCWNHSAREAVVRCPACSRFYCRECVTEHRGRMMCAACVAASNPSSGATTRSRGVLWSLAAAGGFLLAWLIFYDLGALLARIPSDFFDRSI